MTLKLMISATLSIALLGVGGCALSEKRQNDAKVHYMLGVSYLQEPNLTQALKEFLIAQESSPDDADIQMALGQAYQLKKAYADAERHYLRALELDEDNPLFQNNLASLYLDIQRWDEAIRFFRQAGDNLVFANSEVAWAGMAVAYTRKGDLPAAETSFLQAIERNGSYLLPRVRLGELYLQQNRPEQAAKQLRQAVVLAPDAAEAHYLLGVAYLRNEQKAMAVAAFRETLRLAADSEFGRNAEQQLRKLR